MDRQTIAQDLHGMIFYRLFGDRPWLADYEACAALRRKLDAMGLQERISGHPSMTRDTALGREVHLDLVMVFIGLMDETEIPATLEGYGLLDEVAVDRLYDQLEASEDPERVLRPVVQTAYRDHFHLPGRLYHA